MSTFLVSFAVVAATIAAVVYAVLNGPDQPATIRREPSRGKSRRAARSAQGEQAAEAAESAGPGARTLPLPSGGALALPDSDIMRLRVLPAAQTTLWGRLRSGVVLVVLVAVLGGLLALAIGGSLVGLGLLVRSIAG